MGKTNLYTTDRNTKRHAGGQPRFNMIDGVIIKKLETFGDSRGWLMEVFRQDEFEHEPVMAYVSETKPGVIRGPHEHKDQSDFLAFLSGEFIL